MSLTPAQKAFYAENGYIHIPGLLTPEEAAAGRAEIHAIAERSGRKDATWASVKGASTALTHCHDVQTRSALMTRLLLDPRLTGVAQDIIGPNVQFHHSKMFIKPPERGSPFPMHQDHPYFPHERHSMIAVILHFDDAPDARGCLRVYPGSHKLGPLPSFGEDRHVDPERFPLDGAARLEAKAGDAIFFSYLLVHGSGLNLSDSPRTTLLVQLRDPEDRSTADRHQSHAQGMMLAGIDPTVREFAFAWEASGPEA
jgi:ectoine hydroxylase-related dioxygenase (phytanoyl-CoA dioxygenase family)